MKKIIMHLIIFSLVLSNCNSVSSIITAKNVTSPVIIGPVKNINGKPFNIYQNKLYYYPFSAEIMESFLVSQSQNNNVYYTRTQKFKEGSNKADVEILKIAKKYDTIIVYEVFLGSISIWYLFGNYDKAFVGINGIIIPHDQSLYKKVSGKSNEIK